MNDYRLLWKLKLKLRKWTTPFHFLFGFLCAALIPKYPVATALLLAGFAFDEYWEWKTINDTGEQDFWEGLVAFAIGMGIVLILTLLEVYP